MPFNFAERIPHQKHLLTLENSSSKRQSKLAQWHPTGGLPGEPIGQTQGCRRDARARRPHAAAGVSAEEAAVPAGKTTRAGQPPDLAVQLESEACHAAYR